jgi:predicted DNA repair protein MutK
MPTLLSVLSFVGMLAMLWVGGGILVHGLAEFGIDGPERVIERIAAIANYVPVAPSIMSWLLAASAAGLVGLAAGAAIEMLVSWSLAIYKGR